MSGHHDYENGYKRGHADGLAANDAADLREAVRFAVGCIEGGDERGTQFALIKLKEAIAKAKGEKE
jgi:hypothetical protein